MHPAILLFLCGDLMLGRGIDQALPHSCPPALHETYVRDARQYVRLAEEANGPIERPVSFDYVWADALEELRRREPDARIVNLETAVTCSDDHWPGKGVHYRMHPRNVACLTAAGVDCCALANNHVLDWGYPGLRETVRTLEDAGIGHPGAGAEAEEAAAPAIVEVPGKGRVLVYSFGSPTAGVPREWAATETRAGVNYLPELSEEAADEILQRIAGEKRAGDVAVVSIHWGGNWGYHYPQEQVAFAHRLIEGGVSVVHGHSSHHVKGLEVHRGGLILYGSGDFINDYEGIGGREQYRPDLTLMYFPRIDPETGKLKSLRLVPMQIKNFRLNRAGRQDAQWLAEMLNRESKQFGTAVELHEDNTMTVGSGGPPSG